MTQNSLLVIMGVAGSGKSTIAKHLSQKENLRMVEADLLHPHENIARMRAGIALTNDDRVRWTDTIINTINMHTEETVILACSALNDTVRSKLETGIKQSIIWIALDVPQKILADRIQSRKGHFMPATLLPSQLESYTIPKNAIRINGTLAPDEICEQIITAIK